MRRLGTNVPGSPPRLWRSNHAGRPGERGPLMTFALGETPVAPHRIPETRNPPVPRPSTRAHNNAFVPTPPAR